MRQLDGCGVLLKQGTLIAATPVRSAARRPRVKEGKTSGTDPDARFGTNNQHGRFAFGYWLRVGVDARTGLVPAVDMTPANVDEVTRAGRLIQGDERRVYADRGYDNLRRHPVLRPALCRLETRRGRMAPDAGF